MATTAAPKGIEIGARVEVKGFDFKAPGMPEAWFPGVVEEVAPKGRLFDVLIRMADGRPHRELVGPRGGGRVRKAA